MKITQTKSIFNIYYVSPYDILKRAY